MSIAPGSYLVTCSDEEHCYEQDVPSNANQEAVCGVCGGHATFAPIDPTTRKLLSEVESVGKVEGGVASYHVIAQHKREATRWTERESAEAVARSLGMGPLQALAAVVGPKEGPWIVETALGYVADHLLPGRAMCRNTFRVPEKRPVLTITEAEFVVMVQEITGWEPISFEIEAEGGTDWRTRVLFDNGQGGSQTVEIPRLDTDACSLVLDAMGYDEEGQRAAVERVRTRVTRS